jgi:hypothetical protein
LGCKKIGILNIKKKRCASVFGWAAGKLDAKFVHMLMRKIQRTKGKVSIGGKGKETKANVKKTKKVLQNVETF